MYAKQSGDCSSSFPKSSRDWASTRPPAQPRLQGPHIVIVVEIYV